MQRYLQEGWDQLLYKAGPGSQNCMAPDMRMWTRNLWPSFHCNNINNTIHPREGMPYPTNFSKNTHQLIFRLTAPSHSRKCSGVHECLFPWRAEAWSDGHNRSLSLWALRVGLHFSYVYWDRRTFRCPSRSVHENDTNWHTMLYYTYCRYNH